MQYSIAGGIIWMYHKAESSGTISGCRRLTTNHINIHTRMKRIQIRVSSLMSRVCAFIMGALGVTSCVGSESDDPMICMYGTPTGQFEIKGKVTSEAGDEPVSDAVVVLKTVEEGVYFPITPDVETDSQGEYLLEGSCIPVAKVRVVCTPTAESGLAADSVDVTLKYVNDGGSESEWYHGKAESTINFKLQAKKNRE